MARMLGKYTAGCLCRDCNGGGSTRWRKRVEAREWSAAEGLRPLLPEPFADESDCRHGCNGDEIVNGHESDACDFTCHPGLELDPERAARFDAIMARLEQ